MASQSGLIIGQCRRGVGGSQVKGYSHRGVEKVHGVKRQLYLQAGGEIRSTDSGSVLEEGAAGLGLRV